MSKLINCPTCEKEISSAAISCPNCGEVINPQMAKPAGAINLKDPVHLVGVAIAVLVVLSIVIGIIASIVEGAMNS